MQMKTLGVGDVLPDLTFRSFDGRTLATADLKNHKSLVLFFYPKDDSPVCTAEACSFRDAYQDFIDAGAEVIGISSDSNESHGNFATRNQLPFFLVTDTKGSLRKTFGVPATLGFIPGRVTYVIDRAGIIRLVFNSMFQGTRHVEEALRVVRSFPKESL